MNSFEDIIKEEISIKKGLINSMGCNLKKYKSNHLLAPFTSTPITGTNIRSIKNKIKNKTDVFLINFTSINEIKNIKNNEIITKIKCLEKQE